MRGYGFEKLGVVNKHDVIESVSGLSSFLCPRVAVSGLPGFWGLCFWTIALNNDAFAVDLDSLRYTAV
ncbi:MAG: hypothetical protein R2860_16650 [Desulfobacterales bacterium]